MTQVEIVGLDNSNVVRANTLRVGDYGVARTPEIYAGELILKTYSVVVSLTNPSNTWDEESAENLWVEPVDKVTITFE